MCVCVCVCVCVFGHLKFEFKCWHKVDLKKQGH